MTGPTLIPHDLIKVGGVMCGLLLAEVRYSTPIIGHVAEIQGSATGCTMERGGTLTVKSGFVWDFGSGPAIDTPAVVRASLAHDALCLLTDRGLIPWKCRAEADAYYRSLLIQYGCSKVRAWYQWAAVRSYSKTVAYWRKSK